MKANVVRLMAGGLAAVMLMSNMTVTTVLADELDAPVWKQYIEDVVVEHSMKT